MHFQTHNIVENKLSETLLLVRQTIQASNFEIHSPCMKYNRPYINTKMLCKSTVTLTKSPISKVI